MTYRPKPGSCGHLIYTALLRHGQMTCKQCADVAGIKTRFVKSALKAAIKAGAVSIEDDGYGWPVYVAYRVPFDQAEPVQTGSVSVRRPNVAASVWEWASRSC